MHLTLCSCFSRKSMCSSTILPVSNELTSDQTLSIAFNSDLSKIPGPFFSRFTGLPLKFAVLGGNRSVYIHGLHEQYGMFTRLSIVH